MSKKFVLASFLSFPLSLSAADHVKVDVSSKVENNELIVQFKITPNIPLKLNFDAPWHFPYELPVYSCTTDGLQCFRDVLKGDFQIKTSVNKKQKR